MSEVLSVQWFPGHMAKTRRLMMANMKLVDIVIELTDARIPLSSRNPEIDRLIGHKPRLVLLNKSDMADSSETQRWITWYRNQGIVSISVDCRSGKGLKKFLPAVREVLKEDIVRWQAKGLVGRPIRMMIVGIPNVGKSSLINRLAGGRRAKVADRPGVTRGKQWVKLEDGAELLDMPGVLWPKFEDKEVGERLAFVGAIKDDILDIEYLACRLLEILISRYASLVTGRYGIKEKTLIELDSYTLLETIGRKRGMMMVGGNINTQRAAVMLLDEFRDGLLGGITLERVEEDR